MADGDQIAALRSLVEKMRAQCSEMNADGDYCCALVRKHDADDIEAALLLGDERGSRTDEAGKERR